jgi:predicted nucleotidyltransferase
MSNIYKVDINKIREQGFNDLLDSLEKAFEEAGVEHYYLIGATARDVWFSREDIRSRTTKDVDFAIYIAEEVQFRQVKAILTGKEGFHEIHENSFALINSAGYQIDILPFGVIEVDQGEIVGGQGLFNMKVNGLREINKTGTIPVELGNKCFQVASLSSIILLKLIAYDDRPENRVNDPRDIAQILKVFYAIELNAIFDHHFDLLDEVLAMGDVFVSARVIGRQMKKVLHESTVLSERITSILAEHKKNYEKSGLISAIAKELEFDLDQAALLLAFILQGIEEGE